MNNWLDTLVSKETGQFYSKEQSSLWSEMKRNNRCVSLEVLPETPRKWNRLTIVVNPDLPDFVTSARGGTGVHVFSNISRASSSIYASVLYSAKHSHVATTISSRLGHIHDRHCLRLHGQTTLQLSSFASGCSHSDKMLCLWLKQDSVRFVNILVRITWVPSAQWLMPFGTGLDVGSQWHVSCAVWLLFSAQTHTSIFWAPSALLQIVPLQNSWILLLPFKSLETQRSQFFLVYVQNGGPLFSASHFLSFNYGLSTW